MLPDVYLQEHIGDGNPTLVAFGHRYELGEAEKVQWAKILVSAIRPQQIIAKPCECVTDE